MALSLRVAHYSNGQSGCLLEGSDPDEANPGECVPRDTGLVGGDVLNTRDGSFSSNYIEPALTLGRLSFGADSTDRFSVIGSVAARWFPNWPVGHMDGELASRYQRFTGSARVETRLNQLVRLPNWGRFNFTHREQIVMGAEVECARRPRPYRDCRGTAELALAFPGAYGFGLLVRQAWGWDYYNIAFRNTVPNRLAFGITLRHAQPTWFGDRWQYAKGMNR